MTRSGIAVARVPLTSHITRDTTPTWAALVLIVLTAVIYLGSAGIPALLDDTDSLYAEVAREMNERRDWITPYANAIRYLEKPPLFYWLISLSYAVSGVANAFTARLPTALAVTALVFVTFKIGTRLFGARAGIFAGLALATSVGMFLFTRIILPDALFTLLLALFFHTFLRWELAERKNGPLLWMYALAAGAVLAKGLIGVVFPAATLFVTLAVTGRGRAARRLVSLTGIVLFLAIAAPWHILTGLRNPGFFWFYFVNEHVLRFLGTRYPMDYGTVPLIPFWLLHVLWLFPWSIYLVALGWPNNVKRAMADHGRGLALLLAWAGTVLVFFSFSSRLEYYTLPALPALALLAGAQCAFFWERERPWPGRALAMIGVAMGVSLIAAAVVVSAGAAEEFLKLNDDPGLYVFYFGHLFDLTPESILALRTPLLVAGLALGIALPFHHRMRKAEAKAAVLAGGMVIFFVAANLGFWIFAPRLTSKPLADAINRSLDGPATIVVDGAYEEASSVAFYTRRPVLLHNGRSFNLEYGSRYPDAAPLFLEGEGLKQLWSKTTHRIFLITFGPKHARLDAFIPQPRHVIATYGEKILLSNLPNEQQLGRRHVDEPAVVLPD